MSLEYNIIQSQNIKLTQSHSQNESDFEQSVQGRCKVVQPTKIAPLFQKLLQSVHLSHHFEIILRKSKGNFDQG